MLMILFYLPIIDVLHSMTTDIHMTCNVTKTVGMVFQPLRKRLSDFPSFIVRGMQLKYVSEFKYLGHVIRQIIR